MDYDEVLRILRTFNEQQLEYVIVGAIAMAFHGLSRATEDIDVFIAPTPQNVERLKEALNQLYDDPDIDEITADDLLGDYPAVRYAPPDIDLYLDILTRLGEFASWDDLEAETIDIDGVAVHVASPATLFWMKKDTVRPQDHADAAALAQRFGLLEEG